MQEFALLQVSLMLEGIVFKYVFTSRIATWSMVIPRLLHLVQGQGEDIFVLAMDFGIFGYHGTILESFKLFQQIKQCQHIKPFRQIKLSQQIMQFQHIYPFQLIKPFQPF